MTIEFRPDSIWYKGNTYHFANCSQADTFRHIYFIHIIARLILMETN